VATDAVTGNGQPALKFGEGTGDHVFLIIGLYSQPATIAVHFQEAGKIDRVKPAEDFEKEKIQGPGLEGRICPSFKNRREPTWLVGRLQVEVDFAGHVPRAFLPLGRQKDHRLGSLRPARSSLQEIIPQDNPDKQAIDGAVLRFWSPLVSSSVASRSGSMIRQVSDGVMSGGY